MMRILKEPHFSVSGSKQFTLTTDLVFYDSQKNITVTIKAGFETDFASIPRLVQNIIPVNGRHRLPAVVHDFLCDSRGHVDGIKFYTRAEADNVFNELMKDYKVKTRTRLAIYGAVSVYRHFAENKF